MKKSKQIFVIGVAFLIILTVAIFASDESSKTKKENIAEPEIKKEIMTEPEIKATGTPADKYSPHEREQHCESSDAKTTQYIREFKIPTPCTQPLSIIADPEGMLWFTETNTGNVASFDPDSEEFVEYQNDAWSSSTASMMWGIAHTEDNEIWFTDERHGALWKFSILDETYTKFEIQGKAKKSSPQKIGLYNDNFVINDFAGNQIVILNHEKLDDNQFTDIATVSIPDGFFTSQAVIDDDGNMWFIMWKFQKETILVKTDVLTQETQQYSLPDSIQAPNGVAMGPSGNIWIADTAGNSFYKFSPDDDTTTEFVTSEPSVLTYGNATGLIKTPITRPYWNAFDSDGNMWFNQQTGNRLAVFSPNSESMIEYDIPSRNPNWSDCGDMSDCGLSQSFGFTFKDDQVWFTEWVENNIGVLDTSIPLPIEIIVDDEIEIKQGKQKEIFATIIPKTSQKSEIILFGNTNSGLITVEAKSESTTLGDAQVEIPVMVIIDENTPIGNYKILIGMHLEDVTVSSYVTVRVS